MNTYERLQDEACEDGIEVVDYPFESERIKGLYCDGTIAIRDDIDTTTEKACVLAEELGHYHTSVGDILDMSVPANRKQERQARLWSYNKLIGLTGLIRAYEHDCKSRYEIADHLDVTEECIKCYRDKYGICKEIDNYVIYFIPHLTVFKKF